MPADRLTLHTAGKENDAALESTVTQNTERAALKVLTGTPLMNTAIAERTEPADLAEAVKVYQRAGLPALKHQTASDW